MNVFKCFDLLREEFLENMLGSVGRDTYRQGIPGKPWISYPWRPRYRAQMEPGSKVGTLWAQGIGHPGTQMTPKTFL